MKKLLLVLGLVLALGACSQDYKGLGDAPVGKRHEAPREIIVMPDKFPNLATVCDGHGHRLFVNTRDGGYIAVVSDPSCGVAP